MFLSEKINKAVTFAAKAHDGQYRRTGNKAPYISHCFQVGLILSRAGFSEEIVMAGILHDIVEDTPVSLEDIENEFGENVASIVAGVTVSNSLPFKERRLLQVKILSSASAEIKAVKTADLVHNISEKILAIKAGENIWPFFDNNFEEAVWGYKELLGALKNNWSHPLLEEFEVLTREFMTLNIKS